MVLELLECNAACVYTIFLFEQCKKSPHITLNSMWFHLSLKTLSVLFSMTLSLSLQSMEALIKQQI